MPTPGDNGANPGGDDSAQSNESGKGNAADKNADDKSKPGTDDDDAESGEKPVTFKSQKELDNLIARRVNRATQDAADKLKLSKEQLLEKERDEALKQVRERDLKDAFVTTAGIDAGKAGRLFRMYRDDIDVDDKGNATNLKDVLKTAKEDFPELFQKKAGGSADGGKGAGGKDGEPAGGGMNAALRSMARR